MQVSGGRLPGITLNDETHGQLFFELSVSFLFSMAIISTGIAECMQKDQEETGEGYGNS